MLKDVHSSGYSQPYSLGQQVSSRGMSELEQMVERIIASYRITRSDQQKLMNTLLSQQRIGSGEQVLIDRVFDLLRAGRLRVVD